MTLHQGQRVQVVEPKKTTWKSQAYAFLADHLS